MPPGQGFPWLPVLPLLPGWLLQPLATTTVAFLCYQISCSTNDGHQT
jgi:hypothetical protein